MTAQPSKWSRPAREARARLTDQERAYRDLRETPFAELVMDLARWYGWRSMHIRPARTAHGWVTPVAGDGKGWPDLTLVRARDRRLIFAELKRETEDPEAEQVAWLEALSALGMSRGSREAAGYLLAHHMPGTVLLPSIEVHVWRPSDLAEPTEDSVIGRILR